MENPIEKFHQWWKLALANSPLQQKSAVCISTIDEDGFPNGRFVDLKSVDVDGLPLPKAGYISVSCIVVQEVAG